MGAGIRATTVASLPSARSLGLSPYRFFASGSAPPARRSRTIERFPSDRRARQASCTAAHKGRCRGHPRGSGRPGHSGELRRRPPSRRSRRPGAGSPFARRPRWGRPRQRSSSGPRRRRPAWRHARPGAIPFEHWPRPAPPAASLGFGFALAGECPGRRDFSPSSVRRAGRAGRDARSAGGRPGRPYTLATCPMMAEARGKRVPRSRGCPEGFAASRPYSTGPEIRR